MIWRILVGASILAIIVGGIVWISGGMQTLTKDKEEVVTITPNTLFGGADTTITYVDKFTYGLLPPSDSPADAPMSYAFVLGTGGVIILLSIIMMRRARRSVNRK